MRKEIRLEKEEIKKIKSDMEQIIALALIKNLYNQGKISELVFKNIKKEVIKKISIENREYLC